MTKTNRPATTSSENFLLGAENSGSNTPRRRRCQRTLLTADWPPIWHPLTSDRASVSILPYYSGGRSRKSTLSCFSLENLPHCCETLTTVAAQFQDAASTGASLIPVFVHPVSHRSAPPPEPPNAACTIPTPLPRLSRAWQHEPLCGATCLHPRPAGQTHAEFAGCPSHTRRGPFTRSREDAREHLSTLANLS